MAGPFLRALAGFAVIAALSGCSSMDQTQQRMVSGGAIGATVGTVGIALTGGCIPCGTAIGGAVGVASGYLIDQLDSSTKKDSYSPPPPVSYPSSYNSSYNNSSGDYPINSTSASQAPVYGSGSGNSASYN